MVEESIAELYHEQEMRCPVHLCSGQEAVAVGVSANLGKDDCVLSNHRSHGHFLAKGGDLKAMMAEIYGKAAGCCGGKGGSMHLVDLDENYLGSTPIVGGIIPVATGVAFGALMKKEDRIAVVFMGDAAAEEGVFAESLNFAALKKIPIVYVCENNLYSVYSPLHVRQPDDRENIAIAKAYGIHAEKGYGNDVQEVDRVSSKAIEYTRSGKGPSFIEFETYRFREHCGPFYDNNLGYRTEEEFEKWRQQCPLENFGAKLLKKGVLNKAQIDEFKGKIKSEIEEAFSFAKESPFPKVSEINSNVYA
jgi:pyruvate dehydrogenase E1 component alpha subunit